MKDVLTQTVSPTHPQQDGKNKENDYKVEGGGDKPRTSRCRTKTTEGRDFVKISAGMSAVGIHVVEKMPS